MVTVYKMDCLANEKSYIGITNDLVNRLYVHWSNAKRNAKREGQTVLCHTIRKYGKESFSITEIDRTENWDEACEKEIYYIKEFQTRVPYGMNMTKGGDGTFGLVMSAETIQRNSDINKGEGNPFSKLTEKDILQIRRRYKKGGISQTQLAEEYNVSQKNIGLIVIGEAWAHIHEGILSLEEAKEKSNASKRRDKSKLIEKDVIEIRNKYKENKLSQYQLAKEYGITRPAIGYIINGRNWAHISEGILPSKEIKIHQRENYLNREGMKSKLTEKDVIDIRGQYKKGIITTYQLAEQYNVHPTTVGLIVNKKIWKYI